jgi:glycosyltransferase involved in cell wall biosynthesis
MAPSLVSILIPAYNAGKWIKQTIGSALAQTWLNKEIIVVDDGSNDDTLEIARSFESKTVQVVTQKNSGAASARNRALGSSRGDYIQWLDADDLLAPNKIACQMKAAECDPSGLIAFAGAFAVFYYRLKKARSSPNALWQDRTPVDWLLLNTSENLWLNPAAWLVSRQLTEKAGPWDERLSMDDDGEYFARIVAASNGVRFIGDARCFYRQSSSRQVSRDFSEKALESLFLSASLRIRTLLSVEGSERAKKAGLLMLQAMYPLFYPDHKDFVRRTNSLAHALGGELAPPGFSRRSCLLQKGLGPKRGKRLMISLRNLRMHAAVNWDKIMNRLGI